MYLNLMLLDQFFELSCKHTDIMALQPKNFNFFNLSLLQSLLHHGYGRYSTVKLRKAYLLS